MSEQPRRRQLPDEKAKTKELGPAKPANWVLHEAHALQALAAGTATAEQQQAALKWIIETACGTYDLSYRPGSDRDTVFAEGKRFVGLQIVKLVKLNLRLFGKKE